MEAAQPRFLAWRRLPLCRQRHTMPFPPSIITHSRIPRANAILIRLQPAHVRLLHLPPKAPRILLDPRRRHALDQRYQPHLQAPPQQHLRRSAPVLARQSAHLRLPEPLAAHDGAVRLRRPSVSTSRSRGGAVLEPRRPARGTRPRCPAAPATGAPPTARRSACRLRPARPGLPARRCARRAPRGGARRSWTRRASGCGPRAGPRRGRPSCRCGRPCRRRGCG